MNEIELSDFISKVRKEESIIHEYGYELFGNDEFIEFYFTKILGGKRTTHIAPYDCLLPNGLRLEFKHSKFIIDAPKPRGYIHRYFSWHSLRGLVNKQKSRTKDGNVDLLLLSGYAEKFFIWVIPYKIVTRTSIEIQPFKKQKYPTWIDPYEVQGEEIGLYNHFYKNKSLGQILGQLNLNLS